LDVEAAGACNTSVLYRINAAYHLEKGTNRLLIKAIFNLYEAMDQIFLRTKLHSNRSQRMNTSLVNMVINLQMS
jgi:hypothetical protein